ncbi:MAG: succinate dehydrogenase, hydrophobic membrane anchor protein [Bauldia sp.]
MPEQRQTSAHKIPADRKPAGASSRYLRQRLTSILLLPLALIAIGLGVMVLGADYLTVRSVLRHPVVGIVIFAFIALAAYHMTLGIIEIVEDYVHRPSWQRAAVIAAIGYAALVVAGSGYAILRLSFGS